MSEQQQYFGLYCEQCGVWLERLDGSALIYYPAPEIVNAHLKSIRSHRPIHFWKVQEFGKEEFTGRPTKGGAAICPFSAPPVRMPFLA